MSEVPLYSSRLLRWVAGWTFGGWGSGIGDQALGVRVQGVVLRGWNLGLRVLRVGV
jgi:hypothetical protein